MKCNSLEEVRNNIDRIDNEIIKLIAERGVYVSQASVFKKNEDGVRDTGRVEKVIAKVREKWDEIYRKDIYGNKEILYVEPGYTID